MMARMSLLTDPVPGSHAIAGAVPSSNWFNIYPVMGDSSPFKEQAVGTVYIRRVTDNQVERYIKVKNDHRNDDWVIYGGHISQRITFDDPNWAGSALALNGTIPVGAAVEKCFVRNVVAFAGATSPTITVGDGTDADRYNTGTPSVGADAAVLPVGMPSGTVEHTAAVTPVVTIADVGNATAGEATVTLTYIGALA
jgi:hypothetical protein